MTSDRPRVTAARKTVFGLAIPTFRLTEDLGGRGRCSLFEDHRPPRIVSLPTATKFEMHKVGRSMSELLVLWCTKDTIPFTVLILHFLRHTAAD